MELWSELHIAFQESRRITGYAGRCADWPAYVETRRHSWKELYLPAKNAHRKLKLLGKEIKLRGGWHDGEEKFAESLADFYARLLEPVAFEARDLVDGFKEYHSELLKFF